MTENSYDPYDTLVLPGGGSKGFYLLGGIQAAFDLRFLKNIKIYVGTSIGAVISYLLAIGYAPMEIVVFLYSNKSLEKMQHFDLLSMINGNGAASYTPINETLEKMTIHKVGKYLTLSKLKEEYGKTLICTTYNMTTCKLEYLGPENYPDLPCLTALRMSSNIPLIFDRFKYMDSFYVDGGISDNFPVLEAEKVGKKIFGINLCIPEKSLRDEPKDGAAIYFLKIIQIPMYQIIEQNLRLTTSKSTIITIKTDMNSPIKFNVESSLRLDMFSTGYKETQNFLNNKISEEDLKTIPL